jgi:hypothetical protein
LGLGSTDQAEPFQFSMNGVGLVFCPLPAWVAPVAQQSVASTQVTVDRRLAGVVGAGLGVVDQAEPFHSSTKVVSGLPLTSVVVPTAQQVEEFTQATELSSCPAGLATAGAGVTDQVAPFQWSINTVLPATLGATPGRNPYWIWLGPAYPTAQQSELVVQVTEVNWS